MAAEPHGLDVIVVSDDGDDDDDDDGDDDVGHFKHFKFVIQQALLTPDIVQMINVERSSLLDELISNEVITQHEKEHIEDKVKQQIVCSTRKTRVTCSVAII